MMNEHAPLQAIRAGAKEQLPACHGRHEDGNSAVHQEDSFRPLRSKKIEFSSSVTSSHGYEDLEVSVLAIATFLCGS